MRLAFCAGHGHSSFEAECGIAPRAAGAVSGLITQELATEWFTVLYAIRNYFVIRLSIAVRRRHHAFLFFAMALLAPPPGGYSRVLFLCPGRAHRYNFSVLTQEDF